MLGFRAMQAEIERKKSKQRLTVFVFLILTLGGGVYAYIMNSPDAQDKIINETIGKQVAEKNSGFVTDDATYTRAEKMEDLDQLRALADSEARRMVATGDTSTFETEINNNELFREITDGGIKTENLEN